MSTQLKEQLAKFFPICQEKILSELPVTDPLYAFCDNLTLIKLFPPEILFPRGLIKKPTDEQVKAFLNKKILQYLEGKKLESNSTGSIFDELDNARNNQPTTSTSGIKPLPPSPKTNSPSRKKLKVTSNDEQEENSTDEDEDPSENQMSFQELTGSSHQEDEIREREEHQRFVEENSFAKKFPHLPKIHCPRNLFVNTLRPLYLNSLYDTNPHAYPKKWEQLKNKDPVAAWNSLNQTVIRYLNSAYSEQGVKIDSAETSIDFFNIQDLKHEITETIRKSITENLQENNQNNDRSETSRGPSRADEMTLIMSRMHETLRVLTSEAVKRSGQEMNAPPQVPQTGPNLGVSYRQEKIETKAPVTVSFSSYKDLDSDGSGEWIE